jgi:hypothetical protein
MPVPSHGFPRCPMDRAKLPKYAVLIRWGTFRVDLVGRLPILAAVTLIAALVGVKILVF